MDNLVSDINKGIEALLKQREGLKSELETVKVENKTLNTQLELVKKELENLKEKNKTQAIANSLEGSSERTNAKLKINELVREIDRCVALINK